jgi:hypothetical protein
MRARTLGPLLLAAALAAAAGGQARRLELTAVCGSNCDPPPVPFSVPAGHSAERFSLLRMVPGRACAGADSEKLSGFSIRRGREVVFVYYPGPRGIVSDPVPLGDLVLGPGSYALSAAPAQGASVTLEFEIAAQP